jgi:hypothetical protein
MKQITGLKKIGFVLLLILFSTTAQSEETLTLVSSWNSRQNFTAHFLQYIDAVNAPGVALFLPGLI